MRTILITGSRRGIGKAIALQALKEGHRISIGVRNPEQIKGTDIDPLIVGKNKIFVHYYDAINNASAKEWIKATRKYFGQIDTVIHSAGIFKKINLLFKDDDLYDIEEIWKVNVIAPWIITKEIWDDLKAHGKGRIQVLVSMSGKRSKSDLAGYSMSKFALMSLCQTMRNQGWDEGIRVTALCPGWVNTDMSSNIKILPKEKMIQPKDIALLSNTLLNLPNSSVPFEIALNCNLEY